MRKKIFIILVMTCILSIKFFALGGIFENGGYIGDLGWTYQNGGVVLNGKRFYSVAESYREQLGYVVFGGEIVTDVWLYDSYTYHNGFGGDIYDKYLPEFFASCNMYMVWSEETNLLVPENIKSLMKERNCDLAIYLIGGGWFCVANYDKSKNLYYLDMFKSYPY